MTKKVTKSNSTNEVDLQKDSPRLYNVVREATNKLSDCVSDLSKSLSLEEPKKVSESSQTEPSLWQRLTDYDNSIILNSTKRILKSLSRSSENSGQINTDDSEVDDSSGNKFDGNRLIQDSIRSYFHDIYETNPIISSLPDMSKKLIPVADAKDLDSMSPQPRYLRPNLQRMIDESTAKKQSKIDSRKDSLWQRLTDYDNSYVLNKYKNIKKKRSKVDDSDASGKKTLKDDVAYTEITFDDLAPDKPVESKGSNLRSRLSGAFSKGYNALKDRKQDKYNQILDENNDLKSRNQLLEETVAMYQDAYDQRSNFVNEDLDNIISKYDMSPEDYDKLNDLIQGYENAIKDLEEEHGYERKSAPADSSKTDDVTVKSGKGRKSDNSQNIEGKVVSLDSRRPKVTSAEPKSSPMYSDMEILDSCIQYFDDQDIAQYKKDFFAPFVLEQEGGLEFLLERGYRLAS